MAKILIVDDSSTQRESLKALVQRLGHEAITADGGEAGVKMAIEESPDLILMDVVMPGLNGYQATRQLIREPTTSIIPIVLVTSKDQPTDEVWGRRQGAQEYITKPVVEADLARVIERLSTWVSALRKDLSERPR